MQENPNIKYRPSLIEENPALLIWLLLLVAYLLVAVIAKYAWFIRDEQIVEATLWLLLIVVATFIAVQQFLRAGHDQRTSLAEATTDRSAARGAGTGGEGVERRERGRSRIRRSWPTLEVE